MEKQKFIIDRSTWRCGGAYSLPTYPGESSKINPNMVGIGDTLLLNEDGFMCCLGHISLQLGCLPKDIEFKPTPADIFYGQITEDTILVTNRSPDDIEGEPLNTDLSILTDLSIQAIQINDDPTLSLKEREDKLKELFSYHNIELEFINEPVYDKK